MKLLLLNSVCGTGSTGRICAEIARRYEQDGYEVKIAYGRRTAIPDDVKKYAVRIGNDIDVYMHVLRTRFTDRHGLYSKRATREFLRWGDEYDPDILWLHNIHGYYINYELLFAWIKSRPDMQVKWTLHDCWAFTGHCPHYMAVACDRWQTSAAGCHDCPRKRGYPTSFLADNSRNNYERKRAAFTGIQNMTLITPSKWLAGELDRSFLSDYLVEVKHNSVDTAVFRPMFGESSDDGITADEKEKSFRSKYRIPTDAYMILGVSGVWNSTKGLDDFLKLDKLLASGIQTTPASSAYRKPCIVLVGLAPKQIRSINRSNPDIICIERTDSPEELARLYSTANIFVNPTYEDNYPTVNLEAEACGTPVITYNTGGGSETISSPDSIVISSDPEALAASVSAMI